MLNINDEFDDEYNPLDPTGLEFAYDGPQYGSSSRKFSVLGFRNMYHAQQWKDAYYERAMGYNPIIKVIQDDNGIKITVDEMTSCD